MTQQNFFNEIGLAKQKSSKNLNESKKEIIAFNDLTAKEWVKNSTNVWNYSESSTRNKYSKEHGATFSLSLAKKLILVYSGKDDFIFDPFLGIGTTIVAANDLQRQSYGIELSEHYYNQSMEYVHNQKKLGEQYNFKIINDDCRNMLKHIPKEKIQFTLTSPPYANFIQKSLKDRKTVHKKSLIRDSNNSTVKQYSNSPKDFGNLDYNIFKKEIKQVLKLNYEITATNGYSAWIVKDYRDTKNNIPYIPFHSDIAEIGEEVGWKFHDLIILNQNDKRRLIALGYPSVFYTNQNCSFVVIFRKPN